MDTADSVDRQITTEIERLRDHVTDTQELYREVCVLLFFRHGITPTANKLYQLVRKGSMSAPAEALRVFWEDLREKSRIRIEHPDLPEALKTAAGEMVATLWTQAQGAASQNLMSLREQAAESIRLAQAAQQSAEAEKLSLICQAEQIRQQLQQSQERCLQLERELAAERSSKEALAGQLISAGQHQKTLEAALNEARREFASELDKQRQALERSEERLHGSEKRALMEIDRERTTAVRLQRELEQVRQGHQEANDRLQAVTIEYQRQSAELIQRLGQAEGVVQAQNETNRLTATQLESAQLQLKETEKRHVVAIRKIEEQETKIKNLEAQLEKIPPISPSTPRTRRKKNTFSAGHGT